VSPLLLRLGVSPDIVPYARDFLAAFTLGAPATCALSALIQHRQGAGDSRSPMIVGIAGNVFNALLAWALIYGHLGLPVLGVRGAGYATATTEILELASMWLLLVKDERKSNTSLGPAPPAFLPAARAVADLGLPTGIQFTAEMLGFTLFTLILSSISKEEIAANQIAINIIRVSFLPGVAVAEATSVLVGRALGRRRLGEADSVMRSGLGIAVAFMAACGAVFALAGGKVAAFFALDPVVVLHAKRLLYVATVFQVLDAASIVLRGALRGAKDVRVVMVVGVLVVWTFVPTSAYFFGKLCGLGALGGWLGFVGETTFGATLFWRRWKYGSWRQPYASS
jgi:MATE family multidrug resistance protein